MARERNITPEIPQADGTNNVPVIHSEDLHYEHFACSEPSLKVNREGLGILLKYIDKRPDALHLDVATGTGLVPALLHEGGYDGALVGVDPNPTSLAIARQKRTDPRIEYYEGYGQDVETFLSGRLITSATMNDAIHEVGSREDQQAIFDAISRSSKDGGYLFFNSAFTTLANSDGGAMDLGRWKMQINKLAGLERKKKTGERVTGIVENSPELYSEMLQKAGFNEIYTGTRTVAFQKPAIEAITLYPRFTQSFFDDLIGQEQLSDTDKAAIAIEAIALAGIDNVPRVWYESIAQKVSQPE